MANIFISYNQSDGMEYAEIVRSVAEDYFGAVVYVDFQKQAISSSLDKSIRAEIENSSTIIAILTKGACNSRWVEGELKLALECEKDILIFLHKEAKLPLFLGNPKYFKFSNKEELASSLRECFPEQLSLRIPVIIPAGGRGTGLYPLNEGMPKLLLPINTKPILHHILDSLDAGLFTEVRILTDETFLPMIQYYVNIYKKKADFRVICELTSAEYLPQALKNLELPGRFLLYFSDIVIDEPVNWNDFLRAHNKRKFENSKIVGTFMATDVYRLPVGTMRPSTEADELDLISEFHEKPETTWGWLVNMAVAVLEPEFFAYVNPQSRSIFQEPVQQAMKDGKRIRYNIHRGWKHIQTLADWTRFQSEYAEKRRMKESADSTHKCNK